MPAPVRVRGDYARFPEPWRSLGPQMGEALCETALREPVALPHEYRTRSKLAGFDIDRFKRALKNAGLTQKEVAARAGVAQSSLSQWVTGRWVPSAELLGWVAPVLGVEPRWLMGYDPTDGN